MKVQKDFGKRVTAVAEGVPRNVVALLLKKLLPPEPVSVRRPEGGWKLDADEPVAPNQASRFVRLTRPDLFRTRKPRRGAVVHCEYKMLNQFAASNHRYGTWTYAMVASVIEAWVEADEDYVTAKQAHEYLAKHYPKYADRKIDWNWLAKDVGYIELK